MFDLCESESRQCIYLKDVFDQCKDADFTSYIPPMRPCKRCIESNLQCIKRVVMAITSDCEEGNKQCMCKLRKEIEEDASDPHLSLFSVLPDCPHVLKTCKARFSNWYLELKNERGCLALLYTLQNKAEPEVSKTIKKFLKSNNYVRNRDQQDPTAVLKLCNKDLTEYITNIGYMCHTVIPETVQFTTSRRPNTYPNIVNICVGPHGYLFFLTHDETRKPSNIYKVKLRNPIQDITLVCSNVKRREIHFHVGLRYFTGNLSPLSIAVTNKKPDPTFNIDRI